ncbi:MAG: hypothetical protein DMG19_18935 [Acidobacteria bacterium]|nr:MAG: hypothetical protein DMG19_18935 [Acidobacteriota bacterium]
MNFGTKESSNPGCSPQRRVSASLWVWPNSERLELPTSSSKNFLGNDLDEMKIFVERQQAIRDSVERLPARCRSLIEMLYLDGSFRTYQEISQLVGMPAASVGPNRARCLEKLKKILQKRGLE